MYCLWSHPSWLFVLAYLPIPWDKPTRMHYQDVGHRFSLKCNALFPCFSLIAS